MAAKPNKNAPYLKQKPFFSPSFIIFIIIALCVILAIPVYMHHRADTTIENATEALTGQQIDISPEGFIHEILLTNTQPERINNLQYFVTLGFGPDTQDKDGQNTLMAAVNSMNKDTLNTVLSMLPANPAAKAAIIDHQDIAGNTALMDAVKKNNVGAVDALIEQGANLALANSTLETALTLAVKTKPNDLAGALISADVKQHTPPLTLNEAENTGLTALIYAVQQQDANLVKTLLASGADVQEADVSGSTPLMAAASTGNQAIINQLLKAGAKLNSADRAGNTPLTIAIHHHNPELVKMLIGAGADVDYHTSGPLPLEVAVNDGTFDYDMLSYLMLQSKNANAVANEFLFKAVDGRHYDAVKSLLDHGANPNITDEKGETLLYHAIESGDENMALLLIAKGADSLQTGIPGLTPLERAVEHNEVQVAKKLLSMNISPNQKTREGYSIAEMAIYRGDPEILEALLDKNATVEKDFGLLWSIRDGGGKTAPILLAHGAKSNVMTESGEPAIWLAAASGETEALAALIKSHAALESPNKAQRMAPLAIAAHNGQLTAVQLLVEAGAKIESIDGYGMTPLAHAVYMSKPAVAEYLISKGANTKAMDAQGRSILELAELANASPDKDRTVALLRAHG